MPTIEEKRRQLEAKLHEMAEDGVMKRPSVATASYDPIEEKEEHVAQKQGNFIPEEVVCPKEEALTMDAYRSTYFAPLRIREKTSFTMNAETLEILRNVLQDLHERVPMVTYIDHILRAHLKEHRDLLNQPQLNKTQNHHTIMITTLLLDTLLVLSILWTVLGIAYTYDRWRGGSVQGQNEAHTQK